MTSSLHCPECRTVLKAGDDFPWWKHCPKCGWSEKVEMDEKIREELANHPRGA